MIFTKQRKQQTETIEITPIHFDRIKADPDFGLTDSQVHLRMKAHAVNAKVDSSTLSTKEIIRSNIFTYFNLIFVIIAILLVIVGSFRDLTFFPIIIANTLIGIFQELRSKKVLDDLSLMNAAKTSVIRNGKTLQLPPHKLVLDDIIILTAGNQIPADAIVVAGNVQVNESLITGETNEISKSDGHKLLSGSFIISGTCKARLTHVGKNSYINKLALEATQTEQKEQSEMIRSLNRLVKVIGIIILPIGIILFTQQYFFSDTSFKDSITSMVAAIIGMIPEGLYLLTSVSLAVSAMRLAKQKVLLHDMKSIETLARIDVLCVDKTGTITEPGMTVDSFLPMNNFSEEEIETLLGDFVLHMSADNETMKAMKRHFKVHSSRQPKKVLSFSSEYKYSGIVFSDSSYVLGAPEFILREQYPAYLKQIEACSSKGYRVLVLAKYPGKDLDGGALSGIVEACALVLLSNPIRQGAKSTFEYFAKKDVQIKVISGDNPLTVSEIAQKAGILGSENYIDASTLETVEEMADAIRKYTVFGRVTPKQKRQFVQLLKAYGKTVAMTGDGVNDVLALKDADCSIAMASGSDAASQVAQLVLLDSDFTKMPSIVMEGRRVVNNIERTASLYLVKNIFSMLLAIFSMILMLDYPLEPSQVSLISMFTIGIPSFVLALEPNKDQIKGRFMSNVLLKALPAGLTDFLVVSGLVVFCHEFDVDLDCLSTSCSILVAIVGFMILYRIAQPMTNGHKVLIIGVIAGWLFCLLFVSNLFAITYISKQCMMLLAVFALITEPALRYISLLVENLRGFGIRIFSKKR